MMLRWMVERVETDFFSYSKDPVLQVLVHDDWLDIPTEIVINDKRTPDPKPNLPDYPITAL